MIGWFIFGGIVLLLVFLFTRSVTVTAEYGGEKLDLRVKYLFLTLYPTKPKKKNVPEKRAKAAEAKTVGKAAEAEKDEKAAAEETEAVGEKAERTRRGKAVKGKKKKKAAPDLAQIMDYVRSASPPVKRLFQKIRVRGLFLRYVVGTDDAAKTAIKYGSVCAAVYPLVEFLTTYFSVQTREIRVEADFSAKEDQISAYARIKLRVSTALGCILWLGVRMAKTYFKYQKKQEART